jgi:pyruvyl transferase EpsO
MADRRGTFDPLVSVRPSAARCGGFPGRSPAESTAAAARNSNAELIESLRRRIERTLSPLLQGQRRIALLDYPGYGNVGDSAIWLGSLRLLRTLGIGRPVCTADLETCSEARIRERLAEGTILLSGGGNLGDLWIPYQRFRERILAAFPDRPIVQLPQSICFQSRINLDRARRLFDAHPRFTLLVRDHRSLELARREFDVPSLLCPDMAFCLGPQPRPVSPRYETVSLLRTDHEVGARRDSRVDALLDGSEPGLRLDWVQEVPGRLPDVQRRLRARLRAGTTGEAALRTALSATYAPVARARVRRGLRILASGSRVVTDRLHGHVLSLLLGIPHVLLDDRHGKLRGFWETWTRSTELATWLGAGEESGHLGFQWDDTHTDGRVEAAGPG